MFCDLLREVVVLRMDEEIATIVMLINHLSLPTGVLLFRLYLLDLARAFPPEDPNATPHLSGMLRYDAQVGMMILLSGIV